ncbi:MAG TPA: type II toxin-antitoxin system RelE/ParE family toxin [Leeuwenhoekiella sp.]|nr:type II toxin-antitoxin system RelE/ParE family toxin [Leeuwenhoekiella sp.]
MAFYELSEQAEIDIAELYQYGIETFGLSQAQIYLIRLHEQFENLTENPEIGRDASIFSPDLLRYSYKTHAIFFKKSSNGILIVRVLGQKMDFKNKF